MGHSALLQFLEERNVTFAGPLPPSAVGTALFGADNPIETEQRQVQSEWMHCLKMEARPKFQAEVEAIIPPDLPVEGYCLDQALAINEATMERRLSTT
jgi:hypothetical protein